MLLCATTADVFAAVAVVAALVVSGGQSKTRCQLAFFHSRSLTGHRGMYEGPVFRVQSRDWPLSSFVRDTPPCACYLPSPLCHVVAVVARLSPFLVADLESGRTELLTLHGTFPMVFRNAQYFTPVQVSRKMAVFPRNTEVDYMSFTWTSCR